jgi:hypothetical protein
LTKLQHAQLVAEKQHSPVQQMQQQQQPQQGKEIPQHLVNGLILKTALTNPSEVRKYNIILANYPLACVAIDIFDTKQTITHTHINWALYTRPV